MLNSFKRTQDELKGVSKGAVATLATVEFIICLFLMIVALYGAFNASIANQLLAHSEELREEITQKSVDNNVEIAKYRELYRETRAELDAYKESLVP